MQNNISKFFSYVKGLQLLAVLFLLFYVLLCFYNRFAADDFYFWHAQKTWGTLSTVKICYETYSGRWLAYMLTSFLLRFASSPFFLFFIGISEIVLLLLAVNRAFRLLFPWLGIQLSTKERLLYSILFCCSFFFASIDIGESWFWYTSVLSYMLSLIALIFLLVELFEPAKTGMGFLSCAVLAVYIGAASESFAAISFMLVFLLLLLAYSKNKKIQKLVPRSQGTKLIVALSVLCLSFGITAAAPGNAIRLSQLPHPSFFQQAVAPFKSLAKVGYLTFVYHFIALMLLAFPWLSLGLRFRNKSSITLPKFLSNFINFTPALLLLAFVLLLPASLLLSETPPARALSQFSFFVAVVINLSFFFAGQQLNITLIQENKIKLFSISGAFLFMLILLSIRVNEAKRYATAYDERIKLSLQAKQFYPNTLLELKKLPSSGYLYSAELSSDTAHFKNLQWQQFFELKRGIKVKEDFTSASSK